MALNRKQRRDTAIKGKDYYGEITQQIMIADLRVYSNKNIPDGVMIVSEKEADRLKAMIDDANSKAIEDAEALARENAPRVYRLDVDQMVADIEKAGGKVTPEDYAIYVAEGVVLEGDFDSQPLDVIEATKDKLPADTLCIVAKKEGK